MFICLKIQSRNSINFLFSGFSYHQTDYWLLTLTMNSLYRVVKDEKNSCSNIWDNLNSKIISKKKITFKKLVQKSISFPFPFYNDQSLYYIPTPFLIYLNPPSPREANKIRFPRPFKMVHGCVNVTERIEISAK